MGCKAITPHLVGLARKLEGKPFHLVATHCQRDTKENVVAYIRGKGLEETTPNFTVTSFGGHPKVKGNGYVPYYMVFDHNGKLIHHHMGGDFHGGDGLRMIEIVEKALKDAPEIYLGPEPFPHYRKLADQVERKRKLPDALARIDEATEATPGREQMAELARLKQAILGYRDRTVARADALMATDPTQVLDLLGDLAKELKGSSLAPGVESRISELRKSRELRVSIDLYKRYAKAVKRLEKDADAKARRKTADRLEKLVAGNEDLPIAKTIRARIEELRK